MRSCAQQIHREPHGKYFLYFFRRHSFLIPLGIKISVSSVLQDMNWKAAKQCYVATQQFLSNCKCTKSCRGLLSVRLEFFFITLCLQQYSLPPHRHNFMFLGFFVCVCFFWCWVMVYLVVVFKQTLNPFLPNSFTVLVRLGAEKA